MYDLFSLFTQDVLQDAKAALKSTLDWELAELAKRQQLEAGNEATHCRGVEVGANAALRSISVSDLELWLSATQGGQIGVETLCRSLRKEKHDTVWRHVVILKVPDQDALLFIRGFVVGASAMWGYLKSEIAAEQPLVVFPACDDIRKLKWAEKVRWDE